MWPGPPPPFFAVRSCDYGTSAVRPRVFHGTNGLRACRTMFPVWYSTGVGLMPL